MNINIDFVCSPHSSPKFFTFDCSTRYPASQLPSFAVSFHVSLVALNPDLTSNPPQIPATPRLPFVAFKVNGMLASWLFSWKIYVQTLCVAHRVLATRFSGGNSRYFYYQHLLLCSGNFFFVALDPLAASTLFSHFYGI